MSSEKAQSTGHAVPGEMEPSAEEQAAMERLRAHQKAAPRLSGAEEARSLLYSSNGFGVLSTLSDTFQGYPNAAVVGFATTEQEGYPFMVLSTLGAHYRDVQKNSHCALTVTAKEFKVRNPSLTAAYPSLGACRALRMEG
jgi:hypothetical protein